MQNVVAVMDRRKSFIFNWVLFYIGALLIVENFAWNKDLREEIVCYNEILTLECISNSSVLAIHQAYFTTESINNATCLQKSGSDGNETTNDDVITEPYNFSSCYEDIRNFVNRRCSGSNNCNYTYAEEAERNCAIGKGSIYVKYDCVKDSSINRYCNSKIQVRKGYISSPGYPRYYPQLSRCNWSLEAEDGQTIFLKLLHLQTRPPIIIAPTYSDPEDMYALGMLGQLVTEQVKRCDDDALTIMEGNIKRLVVCGDDVKSLKEIEVDAGKGVEVNFRSLEFLPASGFLLYYKVQGCPKFQNPEGTHLLERNGSIAIYACRSDYVFNDTLENTRAVHCVRDHHWNDTLPICIPLEDITTSPITNNPNSNKENYSEINNTTFTNVELVTSAFHKPPVFLEDILIPSILIGILFVGNLIIIIVIFVLRRKQRTTTLTEDIVLDQKSQPLIAEPNAV